MQPDGQAALQQGVENVYRQVDGAYFVQARQCAEHDETARCFGGNGGCGRQGVVGVGSASGRKAVADEFLLFVAAVGDDVYAELGKQAGDFGIGFGVQAARVVENLAAWRADFGRYRAGGDDARHLAVDDVGAFAAQQAGEGQGGAQVAGAAAAVKVNVLPTHARGLCVGDQRAVGCGQQYVVSVPCQQAAEAQAGGFGAAQPAHGGGQYDFHGCSVCLKAV